MENRWREESSLLAIVRWRNLNCITLREFIYNRNISYPNSTLWHAQSRSKDFCDIPDKPFSIVFFFWSVNFDFISCTIVLNFTIFTIAHVFLIYMLISSPLLVNCQTNIIKVINSNKRVKINVSFLIILIVLKYNVIDNKICQHFNI